MSEGGSVRVELPEQDATVPGHHHTLPIPDGPDDCQDELPQLRTMSSAALVQDSLIPMGNLDINSNCLRHDPRNGLALANVPKELEQCGGVDWAVSVVYWFGLVDRINHWWRKERRAIFVSDDYIYVAHVDGHMARAIPIPKIKAVSLSHEQRWVNIIIAEEHDLRFCCLEPCTGSRDGKSVPFFLGVLCKLWPASHGGKALPLKRLSADTDPKTVVNLESPWSWTGATIQYPRSRSSLADHRILVRGGPPPPASQPRPKSNVGQP